MDKDQRKEFKEDLREGRWGVMQFILKFVLPILLVLMVIGWGLQSAGIISMNIERETVQHSRQYTESKQAKMQNLYTQYANLQTEVIDFDAEGKTEQANARRSQQKAILAQMRREVTNIPKSQIPEEIRSILY